jgi:hypothetical protein
MCGTLLNSCVDINTVSCVDQLPTLTFSFNSDIELYFHCLFVMTYVSVVDRRRICGVSLACFVLCVFNVYLRIYC